MINLFGVDVTDPETEAAPAIQQFSVRSAPEEDAEEWAEFEASVLDYQKRSVLPLPAEIIRWIAWFGMLVLFLGILNGGSEIGFAQGYQNAPYLFWLLPVCVVVWMILTIRKKHCEKQTADTDADRLNARAEAIMQKTRQTLGIPEDALDLDVLAEEYVIKDGMPKHKDIGVNGYLCLDLFAFVQGESLFLADTEQVCEIPLSALRHMKLEKKMHCFETWHKEEQPVHEKYNGCKVTRNSFGSYFVRAYLVEVIDLRGDFYLLIPEYEKDAFAALTHLTPDAD